MALIISKIELNNWFGYKGTYEENTFEFSDGVNIIVASNDIGKSKLHNGFRWILSDRVILKNDLNQYSLEVISLQNIQEILNHDISLKLKNGESTTMGVRLTFKDIDSRGDVKLRRITKEIICKKDVNRITITEPRYSVHRFVRENIRTAPESFDDMVKKIIRPNLLNFFLVQGESLEYLTPLKGQSLRTTINNLVSLSELDRTSETSIKLAKYITSLRQDIEKNENRKSKQADENVERKNDLENKITSIKETDLIDVNSFINECNETILKFKAQADIAESQKALKERIDQFNNKIDVLEGRINSNYRNLDDNYINQGFWLSKLTDDSEYKSGLSEIKNEFRDFSAKRRTELDDKLSEREQRMLFALERDQPRPMILKRMLDEGTCFVCSQDIKNEGRLYMEEKLIPFFKKELNKNDDELNKYDDLNSLYLKLEGYLNKFKDLDDKFLKDKVEQIVSLEENKRDLVFEKEEFVKENGMISDEEIDHVSLDTYDQAITDKVKYMSERTALEKKLEMLEADLKSIRIIKIEEDSKKLKTAKNLELFGNDVKEVLVEVKKNAYKEFAQDLENIVNKKFKEFSKGNSKFEKQKIKVEFELNHLNQPDFEIKVVDQFGNNLSQGGGASQALRQLAVVFGLIEKAEGNVDYPFIADAPTSNMTHALTETFFKYQLENASTQNILITKEFWDDQKNSLNIMGERVLERISKFENAKMSAIVYNDQLTKSVTIKNLTN